MSIKRSIKIIEERFGELIKNMSPDEEVNDVILAKEEAVLALTMVSGMRFETTEKAQRDKKRLQAYESTGLEPEEIKEAMRIISKLVERG